MGPSIFPSMTRLLLNNWTLVGSSNLIFPTLIIDLSLLVTSLTAFKKQLERIHNELPYNHEKGLKIAYKGF